jgi:hypothetical protein
VGAAETRAAEATATKMEAFMLTKKRRIAEREVRLAERTEVEAAIANSDLSSAYYPPFEVLIYPSSSTPCLRRLSSYTSSSPMISTTRINISITLACTTNLVLAPPSFRMHQRSHDPEKGRSRSQVPSQVNNALHIIHLIGATRRCVPDQPCLHVFYARQVVCLPFHGAGADLPAS